MQIIKSKICKLSVCILLIAVISFSFAVQTLASASYNSYTYDSYGNPISAPNAYEVETVIYGSDFSLGNFSVPKDVCIDKNGDIYILDSGNLRIVVMDKNFKFKYAVSDFYLNGESSPLNVPTGIAVKDDIIYIADRGNQRVICVEKSGEIIKQITKPDSDIFETHVEFLPTKIVIDSVNNIYIQATGIYQGLVMFDENYEFSGFFGSETVTTTEDAIKQYVLKQFMTSEQKEAMANYVPNEIGNMYVTEDGFVLTVTTAAYVPLSDEKMEMDSIRKLNPKGEDTIVNKMSETAFEGFSEDAKKLNFVDVCCDEYGFITVIDNLKGEILQFDSNMNLVTGFGASGDFVGAFLKPIAVETYDDRIYVLDENKGNLTVFKATEFGMNVRKALRMYNEGIYEETVEIWRKVLEMDANYELAHIGIGNAYYSQNKYKEAMQEYKLARDSEKFSSAFKEYRIIFLRENFIWIVVVILLIYCIKKIFNYRQIILQIFVRKKGEG